MKKWLFILLLFLSGCGGGVFESELITTMSEMFNIPSSFISSNGITTIDINPIQNTLKNTTIQNMVYSIIGNTGGAGNVGIAYTTQATPCNTVTAQATIPITAGVNNSGVFPAAFISTANGYVSAITPYRVCINVVSTVIATPVMADIKLDITARTIIRVEG